MLNKIKAINNYGVEVKDIEKIEDNIFTIILYSFFRVK